MLKTLLDRPISVTMMMLVVVVLGIVSTRLLPVSLIPDVDIPYITVQAVSSQMSAREMDESVVKTLRQQLMQVNGVEEITTESRDGSGTIRLTFSHGSDMDYVFVEVNEKIDRCMSSLPDIDRPKVLKASATDIPAFYINMTPVEDTEEAFNQMSRFAQDVICKRLEQQEEVAMVDVSGYVDDQIMIIPDQRKLDQLGLTQAQFENIVNSSNIHLGSLTIHDGQYRYNVKFLSSVATCEDIANIWLRIGERGMQIKGIVSVVKYRLRIFCAHMTGFAVYSWYYIPVIDFTDYKIGTEIVSQGEYWNLSEEERETRSALPMLGTGDKQDPDITKWKWAIISLYDLPEDDLLFWTRFMVNFRILKKQGYEVVVLTSAPESQMREKILMFAELPFLCSEKILGEMREALYLTSRTTAISLNRNNGGVTFLTDGVITGKRVAKDYPEISSVFRYN